MAEYQTPEWHPAFEEYCEAIFELREDDVDVIQARIAERLEVSRPAVSEMIQRMEDEGLVAVDGTASTSPPTGTALAERVVRRHRLAERFLTDMLGLSWADAHKEAGKWEHVISEPVEVAMIRVLGDPTTCPHGNPIPGSDYHGARHRRPRRARRRAAASPSARIPEELEFAPGLLEFLEDAAVAARPQPARSPRRRPTAPPPSRSTGSHVGIGAFAGARILVTAELDAPAADQPPPGERASTDRTQAASSTGGPASARRHGSRAAPAATPGRAGCAVASKSTISVQPLGRAPRPRSQPQATTPSAPQPGDHGQRRSRPGAADGRPTRRSPAPAHGSTTTTWRPGHHQPCMVRATKVALAHPAASGSDQRGPARRAGGGRARPSAGTASRNTGAHATRPKPAVDEQADEPLAARPA